MSYSTHSSLYDALLAIALEHEDKVAITCVSGEQVTYGELMARIDLAAAGLAQQGLSAGQSIALLLSNSINYIALIVACAKSGIAYYPVLENFSADYIRQSIEVIRPAVLVVDGSRQIDPQPLATVELTQLFSATVPSEPVVAAVHTGVFRMLWSSGSTGFPKVIVWNQHKLVLERQRWIRGIGAGENDVVFCRHALDVAHATDLHVFTSLLAGAKLILCSGKESDAEILRLILRFRPSMMSALPAHYQALAALCQGEDLSFIRQPFCGGSYINQHLLQQVYQQAGLALKQLYGSTDFGLAMVRHSREVAGDLGMSLLPGVRAELSPLPGLAHNCGELVLISPFTSEGYLANPAANAKTFRNGRYYTGDIASLRDDGKYVILGRVNDVLITTEGAKFSAELDYVLTALAAEAEVFTQVAQPQAGEQHLRVAIHAREAAQFAQAQHRVEQALAAWNISYAIESLAQVPRTPVGKIDKPKIFA